MKFRLEKERLIAILNDYMGILKENPIKPILAGVYVETQKDTVKFTGTNMALEYIVEMKSEVIEKGSFVIRINLLLEYVKLLDEEILEFSLENGFLHVSQARFKTLDETLYPKIEKVESTPLLEISGEYLVNLLEKTKFAALQVGDKNMQMDCVRMIFNENNLQLVCTDSFRLIYLKDEKKCLTNKEFSIPMDAVNTLCKLLKGYDQDVCLGFSDEFITLVWDGKYFTCRPISLEYPDYKTILRMTTYDKTMEFNRDELRSALRRVSTVAKNDIYSRKYGAIFNFSNNILKLTAESGKAKITQKVHMIKDGEDFRASLNCQFLLEYVDKIDKNVVISGSNQSSMFSINELDNDDYLYLLMPLALR